MMLSGAFPMVYLIRKFCGKDLPNSALGRLDEVGGARGFGGYGQCGGSVFHGEDMSPGQ